jgi:hypothetical protein
VLPEVQGYLQELARRLKLDPERRREILQELQSHLEDEVRAFQEGGLDPRTALRRSLELLGQPKELARQYYAVHSPASWRDTSLSVLPHLFFAVLFALHLWITSLWVVLFLIGATVISVSWWRRGQPKWAYPWVGYCLVIPIFAWVLALQTFGQGVWSFLRNGSIPLFVLAYPGLLLAVLVVPGVVWSVLVRIIRRDWLYASLIALPFPFLTAWLLYLNDHGGLWAYNSRALLAVDGATALLFLGLAATTAAVYRIGQRPYRVAILGLATPLLVLLAGLSYEANVLSWSVFLLLLLSIALIALPAYMDARLERREERRGAV